MPLTKTVNSATPAGTTVRLRSSFKGYPAGALAELVTVHGGTAVVRVGHDVTAELPVSMLEMARERLPMPPSLPELGELMREQLVTLVHIFHEACADQTSMTQRMLDQMDATLAEKLPPIAARIAELALLLHEARVYVYRYTASPDVRAEADALLRRIDAALAIGGGQ